MSIPPAGIPRADWEATPSSVAALLQVMLEEDQEKAVQIPALAIRIAELEEQKGRSSRNSSKPPSIDGSGFKPRSRDKARGNGRRRDG